MICPKCGHERTDKDDPNVPNYQCPSCDIIYSKYIARHAAEPPAQEPPKIKPEKPKPKILKPLIYLAVIAFISLHSLFDTKTQLPPPPDHPYAKKTSRATEDNKADRHRDQPFDYAGLQRKCNDDPKCIGRELVFAQTPTCQQYIENKADYRFKWTDGFLSSPFKLFMWVDKAHTAIRAEGDDLQFENKYGAWENMTYRCDLRINNGQVINIILQPGRI